MSILTGVAALLAAATGTSPAPDLTLWRLDCGSVAIPDAGFLNDAGALDGTPRTVAVSCYLIRDGGRYLLWDTGLAGPGRTATGAVASLPRRIVEQLAEIGIPPDRIETVALSHYHADHAGQASDFPKARLLIGASDLAVLRGQATAFNLDRGLFAPWLVGPGRAEAVEGDRDIFDDGRVIMLDAPGHTPGHHALLVRLASGPVLLSGDLWHLESNLATDGVPRINTDRAATLASMARLRALPARIVIGHDPTDLSKLPTFPQGAR